MESDRSRTRGVALAQQAHGGVGSWAKGEPLWNSRQLMVELDGGWIKRRRNPEGWKAKSEWSPLGASPRATPEGS